jgi:hypothetical protein
VTVSKQPEGGWNVGSVQLFLRERKSVGLDYFKEVEGHTSHDPVKKRSGIP